MTRRERILATLNHQRPDRIPAIFAARPEVDDAMMKHYGVDSMAEVHRILGTDGWGGVSIPIDFSEFHTRVNGKLPGTSMYSGKDVIFHDETTFEDEWGIVRRLGAEGKYVEWISGPMVGVDYPDEGGYPTVDRLVDVPDLADRVAKLKAQDIFVTSSVVMPFKTAWEQRGMEALFTDYHLNPDFVGDLYDRIFALGSEMLARATAAGVDAINVGGDIAMQDRLIVGPDNWRKFEKPRLAAMIERCKSINPDVYVRMHSDGDLWSIMEDLLEIGFYVIDPIQPECMDPVEVKRKFGDRMVLHGCGSVQRTMPFGTVDDNRNEVITLIEECGYDGGLVIRASNAIAFDCPTGNVVAFFETARDYRWS